jgi:hypothetical protein
VTSLSFSENIWTSTNLGAYVVLERERRPRFVEIIVSFQLLEEELRWYEQPL